MGLGWACRTGLAAGKLLKRWTMKKKMAFQMEVFNSEVHYYRNSVSLIKTTSGNGPILQILKCLWVWFFYPRWFNTQALWDAVTWKVFVHQCNLQKLHKESGDKLRSQIPGQDGSALQPSPATTPRQALAIPSPELGLPQAALPSKPQAARGPQGTGELQQQYIGFLPLTPHGMRITAPAKPQALPLSNTTLLCTVVFN